ncbi:hypothetical protein ABZ371_06725 [Streptomyces sp. NPDC005899]|uniref:hypothetical protein n=1 Tax=Streptomyces sp. NPDC005899 TaxID=3155716 RepID=UPI0033F7C93E
MKTTPSTTTTPATDDATGASTDATEGAATDLAGDTRTATGENSPPDLTKTTDGAPDAALRDSATEDEELEPDPYDEAEAQASAGTGSGAAAVVAAGLGIVSLSGAWTGRVAAERETLIGQIKTSGGGSAAQQISEIYGDAWHSTALVNGLFALAALLAGVFVLVRPAFGAPAARPRPGWIRSVALAGVALGALGVLLSVCMYLDLVVSLPHAGG